MTAAAKTADQGSSRSSAASTQASSSESGRKPWKKKSPVEIFVGQIERLREDVAKKEEELKQAKRQLQKLEEARKVLESA
jgi:hypothetical protein